MKKFKFVARVPSSEAYRKASLDFLYIIWSHINVDFGLPMPIFRVWVAFATQSDRSVAFEVYRGVARGARICRFSARLRVLPLCKSCVSLPRRAYCEEKRFALMATSELIYVRAIPARTKKKQEEFLNEKGEISKNRSVLAGFDVLARRRFTFCERRR